MKTPRSLSYSSMTLWEKNPEEFYLRYLAEHPAPRLPQEPPMAVGSRFRRLRQGRPATTILFGTAVDPQFAFEAIFESQVEPQCRDFALTAGQARLRRLQAVRRLRRTARAAEAVRRAAPLRVQGRWHHCRRCRSPASRTAASCSTSASDCIHCILDWKVRGYCSSMPPARRKGYMLCRDGYQSDKPSKSHGTQHTNYLAYNHRGLTINAGYMEYCNDEYADQLCLYGWLLGEKPGDENVVGMIEEIVAKPADARAAAPGRQPSRPHQGGLPAEALGSGRPAAGRPSPPATSSPT